MQPLRNWFSSYFTPKPAPTAEALTSFDKPKQTGVPSVKPRETTAPIIKDDKPETVSMLTTATNWLSSFNPFKPNTTDKSTQTSEDGSMAGGEKASVPTTADALPKSVSFSLPKGRTNSGLPHEPQETTGPTPSKESPTSILKNSNLVVNEPETVSALSTLIKWFRFSQAPKDNSPALVEVKKTSGEAPKLTSDNKPPQAKRAKTEMSPEEDKAMKSLINKEVMNRPRQDNPDNSILVLENQKRVKKNEVTLDFKNKFKNGDPDFQKRLEQEIKALASLEERTSKALSFQRDEGLVKNQPGAKRAKTKISPEEEAMKNLIDDAVRDLLNGKIDPQNQLYKETRAEVERDFEQKRSKKDPLFKKLLENQIDLLKVQEAQSINGGEKKEVKPTSGARKAVKITDHESPGTSRLPSYGEAKKKRLSKLDPRERDPKQAKIDAWEDRKEGQAGKRAETESAKAEDLGRYIARHNARVVTTNLEDSEKGNKALRSAEALLNKRHQASSLDKSAPSKGDIVVDASGHGHRDSLLSRFLTNPTPQGRGH